MSLLLLPAISGCNGCRPDPVAQKNKTPEEIEEERKKKQPKPNFTIEDLIVQPADANSTVRSAAKEGHWVSAIQEMEANNFDFRGEIESSATNSNGEALFVEHTPFRMQFSRPASLPKGQRKLFEVDFFVPRQPDARMTAWLESSLLASRGGAEVARRMQPTLRMPSWQYHFFVLASDPDRYSYLKLLDAVRPPYDEFLQDQPLVYYQIMLPRPDERPPLPSHPLAWTTIAYLLWDSTDPNGLTPQQQQALLDWLHWGGQLIVSGPGSLEMLQGSFLDPYLPAKKVRSISLQQSAFDELNANWSLALQKSGERLELRIQRDEGMVGVELEPTPPAEELPGTGGLVVERRVGNGRIVLTAFPLAEREVVNWGSYDSFFNAALLRRPSRSYRVDETTALRAFWTHHRGLEQDARMTSTLRYFTRDAGENVAPAEDAFVDWHLMGYTSDSRSGVAGWNDFSPVSSAARGSLREAAGISIPQSDFVLRILAVYLIVLVPINWAVFRSIGRVEWAWVAAPVIATVGAVGVVRMAQLDIGFARSRTEIAVLELQPDYTRGHLTRYTALYTSLSTGYDFTFDNPTALAQPFSADPNYQRRLHDAVRDVVLRRTRQVHLTGIQVDSNTTGMVHSEQMVQLDGPLLLSGDEQQGFELLNQSKIPLEDVGLLRRAANGQLEGAWIGTLAAESRVRVSFEPRRPDQSWLPQWEASPALGPSGRQQAGNVSLWPLARVAVEQLHLNPGDVRLIGWSEQDIPGLTIYPAASQTTLRILVLAHLARGTLPPPQPDQNTRKDFPDYNPGGAAELELEVTPTP